MPVQKSQKKNLRKAGGAQACPAPGAIALVGMAFRFPGDCCDETGFWSALMNGRDLVTEIPPDRWATAELRRDLRVRVVLEKCWHHPYLCICRRYLRGSDWMKAK